MQVRNEDRRVRRTKGLLQRALSSLVHEKPYEAIAVKEILARADVGRSAFYAHFHDKDALLASAIRETLRASTRRSGSSSSQPTDPVETVLGFSGPLFEHIARARAVGGATGVSRHAAVHQRLLPLLTESVARALRHAGNQRADMLRVPVELVAAHIAGTFLCVLDWWMVSVDSRGPTDADRMFRALVTPAVVDAIG